MAPVVTPSTTGSTTSDFQHDMQQGEGHNINKMNIKQLRQELTSRGLPTSGLKPALIERLKQSIQQDADKANKNSNETFRDVYPRLESALQKVTAKGVSTPAQSRLRAHDAV